jgi:hypothetical protein
MRRLWSIFTANASIITAHLGRATNLWVIIGQVLQGKKVMLFHVVYLLTRLVYQDEAVNWENREFGKNSMLRITDDP